MKRLARIVAMRDVAHRRAAIALGAAAGEAAQQRMLAARLDAIAHEYPSATSAMILAAAGELRDRIAAHRILSRQAGVEAEAQLAQATAAHTRDRAAHDAARDAHRAARRSRDGRREAMFAVLVQPGATP